MKLKSWIEYWKFPAILLVGIGVSNVSGWIYFIALNLIVLQITDSPLAVSGLYVIRPLASLCANAWSGSLIDRLNKRNLMILLDFVRSGMVILLVLYHAVWYIYLMVFFIHMASSVFGPASGTYITKLIPPHQRQRFNSLNGLINSGAFLIGPAIAGMLFVVGSPISAIYINAAALFVSGILTYFMPDVERDMSIRMNERMSWAMVKQDWLAVMAFYSISRFVLKVVFLFSGVMVIMATAVDSLEASFATLVLGLSERDYGVLVSVAGAGIIVGASVNTLIVTRVSVARMIGVGTPGVCVGYLIYAFSSGFQSAAAGFFILAFFLAFANTGFATFCQNRIPVDLMGRVGSVNGFVEALLVMAATTAIGVAAEFANIQHVVLAGIVIMTLLGTALSLTILKARKLQSVQID